jgi:hypothetical protein
VAGRSHPYFIAYYWAHDPGCGGTAWNIVISQQTGTDVKEHQFEIYDLFQHRTDPATGDQPGRPSARMSADL